MTRILPALFSSFLLIVTSPAQQKVHLEIDSTFGSYVEDDFPFFCQTLDAREFGENPEPTNLVPRGIILKLGNDHYGCFDPDLLRWALIWKANEDGEYLTMDGMAPGSYRLPNRKAPSGQKTLPKPIGTPLFASAAIPFGDAGKAKKLGSRSRNGADEGEIGLGPVDPTTGRFLGLRLTNQGLRIEMEMEGKPVNITIDQNYGPYQNPADFPQSAGPSSATAAAKRWGEFVEVSLPPATSSESAFTFDDLPLPVPNPWKRNVRLAGFDFFSDGSAAFCTFDGDVWTVEGLTESPGKATWSRFASGLHEPKSVCIVDDEVYVFDRNGIVKLNDTDGNGEADWYENFSNIVPQTAETREFAMDMVAARDGGFFLAKGGQVGSTRGIANGTVVKVSSDGGSYDVFSTGLRQPYIGYDPETGILTSSDQQGNWKPATPIYQLEQGGYYGFQPAKLKDEAVHPAPIDLPAMWIPHFINQSGAGQVWMKGANGGKTAMGAIDGDLVHIGFNRPELFRIYLHESGKQGAASPILSGFPSGILKGRINPADGLLYVCGFEIWGSSGTEISGLYRVHPTEAKSWIPQNVEAEARGVLLTFDQKLSPELAGELGRYSVDRWNYEQTHQYGSGNFKLDGEPGQESVSVASATLSKDQKSLFLGLVGMAPSDSLRVTYRLPVTDETQVDSTYLSVFELEEFDLTKRGFSSNEVDLTPKMELTGGTEQVEPSAKLGKEVSMRYGCIACHAVEKSAGPSKPPATAIEGAQVAVGPPWYGLWKSRREFLDGSFIKNVDETYLRESILDPSRRVPDGYAMEKTGVGMPSYLGVLKDHEIDSIILYIRSLK